jgi:hypothetical protein
MATRKRRLRGRTSALTLPAPKTGLVACPRAYSALVYGPEGIGKSTLWSRADRHLFIATEAGLNWIDCAQEPCEDWEKFREIVKAAKQKPDRYDAFIIDTAENAFDQAQMWVCEKLGIDHPADEDFGKGYQTVRIEFYMQLNALVSLGKKLLMTSHEKSVEIKGRAIKTSKMVPTLTNTARRVVLPMVDIIGHCGFKMDRTGEATTKRIMEFEPTETVEAKDRTGLLPARTLLNYEVFAGHLSGERKQKTLRRRPKRS